MTLPVYHAKNSVKQATSAWGTNKIKANGCCFTVVSVIDYCWHIKFRHAKREWYGENQKQLVKSSANCRFEGGWTPMVSPRYNGRLLHSPWWDSVRMHRNQYTCGAMWDMEHLVAMASMNIYKTTQINKRRKVCKNITISKLKNKTEDRGQSIPQSIGILTVLRCICGPNLEILT